MAARPPDIHRARQVAGGRARHRRGDAIGAEDRGALTSPRPYMPSRLISRPRVSALASQPLVSEWTALVRETGRERQPDQISNVLRDLGPMPDADDPDDLALWAAALVNPLPALGVAVEIRPYVLEASTPMERVEASLAALNDSISKLRGRPPGTFEVEPPPKQ